MASEAFLAQHRSHTASLLKSIYSSPQLQVQTLSGLLFKGMIQCLLGSQILWAKNLDRTPRGQVVSAPQHPEPQLEDLKAKGCNPEGTFIPMG